jgi:hypothetical protein
MTEPLKSAIVLANQICTESISFHVQDVLPLNFPIGGDRRRLATLLETSGSGAR